MDEKEHLLIYRPTPLILDEQGRAIDVTTGQAIQLQHHTPTLKVTPLPGLQWEVSSIFLLLLKLDQTPLKTIRTLQY